jgi:hypothetical protein
MDKSMASKNQSQSRGIAKSNNSHSNSGDGILDGAATRLEKLVTFVQANWKEILKDLVGAGVTAYLEHNARAANQKDTMKQ